jgi:hypothetical protein
MTGAAGIECDGLWTAIREFVTHYHCERNPQGLGNQLVLCSAQVNSTGRVRRPDRLDGLLNYYYREAE